MTQKNNPKMHTSLGDFAYREFLRKIRNTPTGRQSLTTASTDGGQFWGVVQGQHTSLWSCGSWFESRRPSQFPAKAGLLFYRCCINSGSFVYAAHFVNRIFATATSPQQSYFYLPRSLETVARFSRTPISGRWGYRGNS